MTNRLGATPAEWAHFDLILGLTADLLPVVSNPDAEISPNSSIKALGKLPSRYNKQKLTVGIADWTSHQATAQNIERWSQQPDYGICLIARTIRAIDIDVENPDQSAKIAYFIAQRLGVLPMRRRNNSGKLLLAFEMPGELGKRSVAVEGGMIEILGNNQQFIACGTHTSGARYDWVPTLPDSFPQISLEQFNAFWGELVSAFGIAPPSDSRLRNPKTEGLALPADPVSSYLTHKNLIIDRGKEHQILIECPWKAGHSTDSGPTETAYFPTGSCGYEQGHFHCLHASCANRTDSEFMDALGYTANDFDIVAEDELPPSTRFALIEGKDFAIRKPAGWIIKGVLPRARLAVLFGEAGAGKSFVALDMALSIARGKNWNERTTELGRVVYVCAEGVGGFSKRLLAYQRHYACDLPIQIIADCPNFLLKDDVIAVTKSILTCGQAEVIVIDTFAQVTPGANENTAEDMGKALAHCNRIHEATGALIVLVHHAGKNPAMGARGWSGIKAAADAEIEIKRDGEQRFIEISKQKDGEDGMQWSFRLEPVQLDRDDDGDVIGSCVIELTNEIIKPVKQEKLGKRQKMAIGVWGELGGVTMPIESVVEEAHKRIPKPPAGEKDRRREYIRRAIEELGAKGKLIVRDDMIIAEL